MTLGDRLKRANWPLLGLAVALTVAGASTVSTAAEGHETPWTSLQIRWAVIAFSAGLLVLAMPYRRVVQAGWLLYGLGVAALVLVLVKGTGQSAGRWIRLGSFKMQPSEFMKVILVVALAGTMRYSTAHRHLRGLFVPFAITLLPVALVMKQPDLGTAMLLVPILFAVLYAAGARVRHLALVSAMGVAAGVLLFFLPGVLKDYQKDRIHAFLLERTDSKAAASMKQTQSHQLNNGLLAVGLGGISGASSEDGGGAEASRGLPERHTDFIFPVFAASYGFLGVTALFLLYLAFLGALLSTALRVREPSGRLLVVGVFTLFAVQILVNLGMTVGLLPVVGVTLPFFSYGGSSLLTSFLALGLVLNVGADPPIEFGRSTVGDDE